MIRQLLIATAAIITLSLTLGLSACGGDKPAATAQSATSTALPSDPALAELYQQTCMACHSRAASGAPVTGNAADWEPRLAKGKDTLLDNTINGFRGMPPLGACYDCGEEEFAALIDFMSTAQ